MCFSFVLFWSEERPEMGRSALTLEGIVRSKAQG